MEHYLESKIVTATLTVPVIFLTSAYHSYIFPQSNKNIIMEKRWK